MLPPFRNGSRSFVHRYALPGNQDDARRHCFT